MPPTVTAVGPTRKGDEGGRCHELWRRDDLQAHRLQRVGAGEEHAGTLIGTHDLWLAATCIAHGLTMVTANTRELARVRGLDVELWGDPR